MNDILPEHVDSFPSPPADQIIGREMAVAEFRRHAIANDFGYELATALGIETKDLKAFTVHFCVDDTVVEVEATYYASEVNREGFFQELRKRYELELKLKEQTPS